MLNLIEKGLLRELPPDTLPPGCGVSTPALEDIGVIASSLDAFPVISYGENGNARGVIFKLQSTERVVSVDGIKIKPQLTIYPRRKIALFRDASPDGNLVFKSITNISAAENGIAFDYMQRGLSSRATILNNGRIDIQVHNRAA